MSEHLDDPSQTHPETTLQLLEERVGVTRRRIAGQTVRVTTSTQSRDETIEAELAREAINIQRVPIGRVVETTPDIRHEGDVTIIPVMAEELVLQRRLILKEEIRITVVRSTEVHRQTVELRSQTASVTRIDPAPATAGDSIQPEI